MLNVWYETISIVKYTLLSFKYLCTDAIVYNLINALSIMSTFITSKINLDNIKFKVGP